MKTAILVLLAFPAWPQGLLEFLNGNRPVLDAHNCYPYKGAWSDRIDRALSTGFPVGIEQDLAWYVDPKTGKGRILVSHTASVKGDEPELRKHFFERVRPLVEKALAENDRARWPIIVLHFDFKSLTPPLLRAVWDLLGEYEGWISTARKPLFASSLTPIDAKPLLVLTEEPEEQEVVFYDAVPVGGRLRLFGSAQTRAIPSKPKGDHDRLLVTLPPEKLLPKRPTAYRRWWNSSWYAVEEGGASRAGEWTPADQERLRALVDRAHRLGYWIRFYTLDGFIPEETKGWDQNYNFGSREAAEIRWKAAIAAGVNLIASDQYEDLAAILRRASPPASR